MERPADGDAALGHETSRETANQRMTGQQDLPVSTRLFALLRTLQLAIIAMSAFYVGLGEILRRTQLLDIPRMLPIISGFAVAEALAVVYFKKTKIPQVEEMLRRDAEDRSGLEAARKWYV